MKIIFGSSVHKHFDSFLDLYKGVQKFYDNPLYLFASNEDIGRSSGNLRKFTSRRNYKWRRSHNFIFDVCGELKGLDFDFFTALDSDCLVADGYLSEFLCAEEFDFVVYPNLNGEGKWYHGNIFKQNMGLYEAMLSSIGLKRMDERIVGNFNPLIILSKRAVGFLQNVIEHIENTPAYAEMMKIDFSVGETLIFNLLKDAGLKPRSIDTRLKTGLRYRPYWDVDEFKEGISVYHPVRLDKNDLFRRLVGLKASYDGNILFIPAIAARKLYLDIFGGRRVKAPAEGEGWFNP